MKVKAARDQGDKGLAFDGVSGLGYSRSPQRFQGNASKESARENYGRGPTVAGRTGKTAGPVEAVAAGRRVDPNRINLGNGPRGSGRAEAHCPTNPDMINVGRGPTKGNQQ